MAILIQCDICEKQFTPEESQIVDVKIEDILVACLQCPRCSYRYPVMYMDKKQKELHSQIKSIQDSIQQKRRLGKEVSPARIRQLNQLLEDSQKHQAILRYKYRQAVTDQLNKDGV